MRRAWLLLALTPAAAGEDADDYFEIGLAYLRQGFYGAARRAFTESLLQAPAEPVSLTFLGLACAAEGRPAAEASRLLRDGHARLPEGKTLDLDLVALLPSPRALRLLREDYARRLVRARAEARRDVLSVLAFLEVHGPEGPTPSLDALEKEYPDVYASRLRAAARPCAAPTTSPSPSAPSSAAPASRRDRSRR